MMLEFMVRTALPDWNERVLSDEDFDNFCVDEGVRVVEVEQLKADTGESGLYIVHRNSPFIVLDSSLRGTFLSWVKWHEAGHHILHIPGTQFFTGCSMKIHNQANTVAACALMPKLLIQQKGQYEIWEEYGYPMELISFRYELLGIRGL